MTNSKLLHTVLLLFASTFLMSCDHKNSKQQTLTLSEWQNIITNAPDNKSRIENYRSAVESGIFAKRPISSVKSVLGEPDLEDFFYPGNVAYKIGSALPPDDMWLILDIKDGLVVKAYVASD